MSQPRKPRSRRLAAFIVVAAVLAAGASTAIGQGTSTTTTTSSGATGPTGTTTTTTTTSSTTSTTTSTSTSTTKKKGPPPPVNDNYLSSLNLNGPGKPLNDSDTLTDTRNIDGATVQKNIFSPQSKNGPPELTGCNGTSEGHTIWYDFYPNLNGLVEIRTSASFDTVIAVVPFDKKSLLPINSQRKCVVNSTTHANQLFVDVTAGTYYTVQLGGVGKQAGNLEFLFDYVVSFKHLNVNTTLEAVPTSSGVSLLNLTVTAPVSATVRVQCTTGCAAETRTGKTTMFPGLKGSVLPAGATVEIFATAKNEVGQLVEYKILPGNFMKVTKCLKPNTLKVASCNST